MAQRVIRIRSRWAAVLIAIALILAAVPLGLTNTPYQEGRAVALTRERQAMMAYLRDVAGWTTIMGASLRDLQDILEETAANPDSGRMLQGGQRGAQTLQRLGTVAQEVDGAQVPAAMSELHRQAREALALEITAAQSVLACVGAPRAETIATARKQLAAARTQLEVLNGLVQQQRKAISRQGGSHGW